MESGKYIYIYIDIYIDISEVGGSEFAFMQDPPELGSCSVSCVRARGGMLRANGGNTLCYTFSLFAFPSGAFFISLGRYVDQ